MSRTKSQYGKAEKPDAAYRMFQRKRQLMGQAKAHIAAHCGGQRYMAKVLRLSSPTLDKQVNGEVFADPEWLAELFTSWFLPTELNFNRFIYLLKEKFGSFEGMKEQLPWITYSDIYKLRTNYPNIHLKKRVLDTFAAVGYYRGPADKTERDNWITLMGEWHKYCTRMSELITLQAPGLTYRNPDQLVDNYSRQILMIEAKIKSVKEGGF